MMATTTYKIDLPDISYITNKYGLNEGGKTQMFFANTIIETSDPYVPMLSGVLKNSAHPILGGTYIEYNTPYGRVHWYGKVMAGPLPKQPTNIDMNYNGAPKRGPKWVERMWAVEKDNILKSTELFMRSL